jgi:hypothetical protein
MFVGTVGSTAGTSPARYSVPVRGSGARASRSSVVRRSAGRVRVTRVGSAAASTPLTAPVPAPLVAAGLLLPPVPLPVPPELVGVAARGPGGRVRTVRPDSSVGAGLVGASALRSSSTSAP